jgi:hypothetical protein
MANDRQYVTNATCVISFAIDRQIRYRTAEIERAFQSVLGGQATGTNVIDSAPPAIPRFTMQSGPKQVSVSQVTAQLDLDFFSQKKNFDALSPTIKKNFSNFWRGVCEFKSCTEIRDMGMVLTFSSPDKKPVDQLSSEVFDRYLKAPLLGDVASTSFQIGFLDTDKQAFINVAVGSYEMREGLISNPDPRGGPITVELDQLPISEHGIEIKIDVNSKPMTLDDGKLPKNLDQLLFDRLNNLVNTRCEEYLAW